MQDEWRKDYVYVKIPCFSLFLNAHKFSESKQSIIIERLEYRSTYKQIQKRFRLHSHRAKAVANAKIVFDIYRLLATVMFLHVSVILSTEGGGVPAPRGACSGGMRGPGVAWSGGCLVRGGWRPPSRRLLLRMVRILLECILVISFFYL